MTAVVLREQLVSSVAGPAPCGVDLDAAVVTELHRLAEGKRDDGFGTASQPPDWQAVRTRCEELLKQSMHLDVAMPYAVALLQLDGLGGFAAGLELLATLLDRAWTEVYPRLDVQDDSDPTLRINIISTLNASVGRFGDSWQVRQRLHYTPLFGKGAAIGVYFGSVIAARTGTAIFPDIPVLDAKSVEKLVRQAEPSDVAAVVAILKVLRTHLANIENAFRTHAVGGQNPTLTDLDEELAYVEEALSRAAVPSTINCQIEPKLNGDRREDGGKKQEGAPDGGTPRPVSGELRSTTEVVALLDQISRYYTTHQPASPLPLLLERVRRLATADFLTIVADLAPGAVGDFKTATGVSAGAESRTR